MTVLIWSLFLATLLPILAKAPVAKAMNGLGRYDNDHPRAQQGKLEGYGARALAAHQNAFEALIMFAPAVLLAIATNNTSETIQYLATIFIIARVAYNVLYLMNKSTLRSTVWFVGLLANFAIYWLCLPTSM